MPPQAATTGLCTWNGALTLSEWVLQNKAMFVGKTVVELGSGIGLAGILTAVATGATKVVMTDHIPDVLRIIEENIQLNRAAGRACVAHCDWTAGWAFSLSASFASSAPCCFFFCVYSGLK